MDRFRSNVAAFIETGVVNTDVLEEDRLANDERNALLFTGTFLQELKENRSFVADIIDRIDRIGRRLVALSQP